MTWNILWHQAIIHSRLIARMEKKGKTVGFDIPVTCDGTAVRILMRNGTNKPVHIKMAFWYDGIVYPVTQEGRMDLMAGSDAYTITERIPIPLRKGSKLTLRIFREERYKDGNMII